MSFARGVERIGRFGDFFLAVRLWYAVDETEDGGWIVRPTGYEYRLLHRAERDVVTYHWHPVGRSPVDYPHVHLGSETFPSI